MRSWCQTIGVDMALVSEADIGWYVGCFGGKVLPDVISQYEDRRGRKPEYSKEKRKKKNPTASLMNRCHIQKVS